MITIFLRPLALSDTDDIVRWRNQPEVYQNLFSKSILTPTQHVAYYHKYVETGLIKQYIIEVNGGKSRRPIGTTFLRNFDSISKKAEFGIFIGESSARGKGYGRKIVLQVLNVAFCELGLNKVYLSVFKNNIAAIHSYKNAGFRIDGTLRQDFFDGNEYVDIILMSILKSEWEAAERHSVNQLND